MRLELVDGIRILIVAFMSYIPTVAFSGWFTAWVAKKCGDDLPERFGFLTIDPFVHFSLFGFGILIIGQLFGAFLTIFQGIPGFGRYIFLEPQPYERMYKVMLEFFARSIAHIIMLTFSILALTILFKGVVVGSASMSSFGPLVNSLKELLQFFYGQNVILAEIFCLFAIADTICHSFAIPRFFSMHYFLVLIVTLLALQRPIAYLLLYYQNAMSFLFARMLGM